MTTTTLENLTRYDDWTDEPDDDAPRPGAPGLSICWSATQPGRIGEVARVDGRMEILGREVAHSTLDFGRERPSGFEPGGPLLGRQLSRRQLEIRRRGERLEVRNLGAAALLVNGEEVDLAEVGPGDVLEIRRMLVLLVVGADRPGRGTVEHAFGEPDAHGIVGEGPTAWELRSRLRFAARAAQPVLLRGPSGSGKELAARAVHILSDRGGGPFVARNAATFPETLVDAELFGTTVNYPNVGQPARPGLIGTADQGTLFLDEVGEMPATAQAHLLRVLDKEGAYHRLGDALERRSDFRFVGATNREVSELKHDFASRLAVRIGVPGLDQRREDIPLLVRHLLGELEQICEPDAAYRAPDGRIRTTPRLIVALVRHKWTGHVRELRSLLLTALGGCSGRALTLTPELEQQLSPDVLVAARRRLSARDLGVDAIRAALKEADGNVSQASRKLGLSSRYVLYRRMKKLSITA